MPFVTNEFPQRIFENFEDYHTYLSTRKNIIKTLHRQKLQLTVSRIIKKSEMDFQRAAEWILQYAKSYISKEPNKNIKE